MNAVLDIVFTLIEGCCLLYLVKNEQMKQKRQVLFTISYIVTIFGLTQIFTLSELEIKVVFTCGSVVLFYFLILGLPMKKSIFYMMIGEFLLMASELLITNIGLMFQINPGLKEDTSISTVHIIISKIVYIALLVIVQKIISDVSSGCFSLKVFFFLRMFKYWLYGCGNIYFSLHALHGGGSI